MNGRFTGPILGIYSSQAIGYQGMWPRWSQKTKLAYPSNSSDPCIFIGCWWGEAEVKRRETVIEQVWNRAWARPQKVPKECTAQRSVWNSWGSPRVVITSASKRLELRKPMLKAIANSSHPLSLRLNSIFSKWLSHNLCKVEESNSVTVLNPVYLPPIKLVICFPH